ncbi:MAG: glycosyltransferase family 4 protein [Aestuariibacter sp.]
MEKELRVLYFHQHFSTPKGATGIRSYEMAIRLVKAGHEVTMVCGSYGGADTGIESDFINGSRRDVVDGINVIEFDLAYSNKYGFLKRTESFIKFAVKSIGVAMTADYDIVFATSTPLTAGIPGIFARWLRAKTFVFEVRDLWPELPKEMKVITNPIVLGAMSILEWVSYHSAHKCIGLSPGIVDGIVKRGISREEVVCIPNGCDLDIFSNAQKAARPSGVNEDDLMAIFTGTHGVANGLDMALNAAAVLKDKGRNDIKIVLVGQGKLKQKLIDRAKKEHLDNVIFIDPVPKDKLAEMLKCADIGLQLLANVSAFYRGTSPNKFFDYIASGLPVLNNYPGWLADQIEANDCGYVVPPDDPESFADALIHAAENKPKLQQMGLNGNKLAVRSYDRENLAKVWIKEVIEVNV